MKNNKDKWAAFWISFALGSVIGVLLARSADASVLSANSIDGAPIVTQPGGTFSVNITASLSSQTEAVDYLVRASAAGVFTLTGRDMIGSPFEVPVAPNDDGETQLGVLGVGADLDPTNGIDLGADLIGDNLSVTGNQHVARLTFAVAPDAPPGLYTITPTDDFIDGGIYSPGPTFDRTFFDDLQGVSVTVVVPEPAAILSLAPLLMLRRRRR